MIAQRKEHCELSITNINDVITTNSLDLTSVYDSSSALSETSSQLQESVSDLRQQIDELRSTIVDLQNAVTATVNTQVQNHGAPWPFKNWTYLTTHFLQGGAVTTNWNILHQYDLLLMTTVIITLCAILAARYFEYIEPREDLKIWYAVGILFVGVVMVRATSLIKALKRRCQAVMH